MEEGSPHIANDGPASLWPMAGEEDSIRCDERQERLEVSVGHSLRKRDLTSSDLLSLWPIELRRGRIRC